MTDLITAEEAKQLLDECDAETCLTCAYARTVVALHAELAQARADAKAAQALVLEEATKRLAAARETFCYASPGSDEEFTSLLLGFDTAAGIIRDLAPDAGAAELAKLRGERDAFLDAVQANMLRPDYLRAERAEAERDRLAAELAAANAREAGLTGLIRWAHDTLWALNPSNYDHDEVCKVNDAAVEVILGLAPVIGETHGHSAEWWAERAALAQPSTEGGE